MEKEVVIHLINKAVSIVAIGIVVVPIAAIALFFFYYGYLQFQLDSFSKEVWDSSDLDARCSMAGNIQRTLFKEGTDKATILQVLGEPLVASGNLFIQHGCIAYLMGFCGGHLDNYSLGVCFDKEDKVTGTYIYQH